MDVAKPKKSHHRQSLPGPPASIPLTIAHLKARPTSKIGTCSSLNDKAGCSRLSGFALWHKGSRAIGRNDAGIMLDT
eukprot:3897019-Amphidinium_carterae.1